MLPRSHRVPKVLFDAVLKRSQSFHSSYFSLRVGKSSDEHTRCSIVVSKKISNRATKRNSLRRKVYNAIRDLLPELQSGSVFLFFAKKGSDALSYEELAHELKTLIGKAGLRVRDNLIQ